MRKFLLFALPLGFLGCTSHPREPERQQYHFDRPGPRAYSPRGVRKKRSPVRKSKEVRDDVRR